MKVFFNHLAKCGGTSIEAIAEKQYGDNFHFLSASTTIDQLKFWLEKDRVFISSELFNISYDKIQLIVSNRELKKICLTRNPIKRYESFVFHSTRDLYIKKNIAEKSHANSKMTAFWGNEQYLDFPISCEAWLSGSLDRIERILSCGGRELLEIFDHGLVFAVYSQWFLATFKSWFDFNSATLNPCVGNYFKHISETRNVCVSNGLSLEDYMQKFMTKVYTVTGSLDRIDVFLENLVHAGIFSRYESSIPQKNNTNSIKKFLGNELSIRDGRLITRYYTLIPEDFFLNKITPLICNNKH